MIIHAILAIVHVLAAAAWFGAMFYSDFVLHPRARRFSPNDGDFETFSATGSCPFRDEQPQNTVIFASARPRYAATPLLNLPCFNAFSLERLSRNRQLRLPESL